MVWKTSTFAFLSTCSTYLKRGEDLESRPKFCRLCHRFFTSRVVTRQRRFGSTNASGRRYFIMTNQNGPLRRLRSKEVADMTKLVTVALVTIAVLYFRNLDVTLYAFGSIANSLIGKLLKKVIRQPRPDGASKSDHGMPSSHATSLSFLSVASLFNVLRHKGLILSTSLVASLACVILAFIACRWRIVAGYHTAPQVVVGWIVGTVNALFWCFCFVPIAEPFLRQFF